MTARNLSVATKILIFAIILLGSLSQPLFAAKQNSVTLSPISASLNVESGKGYVVKYRITNTLKFAIKLRFLQGEFKVVDDTQRPKLVTTKEEITTDGWLQIKSSKYELKKGESTEVTLRLNIPKNSPTGNYFPAVIANWEALTATHEPKQAGELDPGLVYRLDLNVDGLGKGGVKVSQLYTDKFVISDGFYIHLSILNNSASFAKPIGYLQVVDPSNTPIWKKVINDDMGVLPSGSVISESNRFVKRSSQLWLPPGIYTVELLVIDTQTQTSDIFKSTLVVVPWPLLMAFLIVMLGCFYSIYRRRRNRISK